ncbi:hypothetical protein HDU82_002852 [Entophlyctis luteolus]|nr:hypothetical protein HDU82_002852 [Entophlyctis luteolus]
MLAATDQTRTQLASTRSLVSVLRAIALHLHADRADPAASKLRVLCRFSRERGLMLSVLLPHRTCQLHASLPRKVFTTFHVRSDAPANNDILCVDLDSFLDSVSVFGGPSALPFASPQSSGDDATAPLNSGKSWNRPQTSRSTSAGKYASSGQPPVSLDMVHDMQSSELVLT